MLVWKRLEVDFATPAAKPIHIQTKSTKQRPAPKNKRAYKPTQRSPQLDLDTRVQQPYDLFLVLDVEATCVQGSDFNWPNEIIEFPVCLMRWKDKDSSGKARQLVVVDEFRSFVRPTWSPVLSEFCTELTGIKQSQVQDAPIFSEVIESFQKFLVRNGLVDGETGERLQRFCWCSDGPYDIRDFVVKQCFISKMNMPEWLCGDVLDVRMAARISSQSSVPQQKYTRRRPRPDTPRTGSFNIASQLEVLGLGPFVGRQHSGIDDTRNICRILQEVARRDTQLLPNTGISTTRRWNWMGPPGVILEEQVVVRPL